MVKQSVPSKRARLWRVAATTALVGLAAYWLTHNASGVQRSLTALLSASPVWVIAGVSLTLLTFLLAAGIYYMLALRPLRYRQTLVIEFAAAAANRLLPAGLGGLGLNGLYLYKKGHSSAQATAVVSVNNLLGIGLHLCLLTLLIGLRPEVLRQVHLPRTLRHFWAYLAAVLLLGLFVVLLPAIRHQLARFFTNLFVSLRTFPPRRIAWALLLSLALTVTYTLILLCAARSVGLQLNPLQLFVVFSAGMLAATVTPTPGGLVGAEAGLFGGFMVYGASPASAGAAVLLYRLFTYWLPLVPGLLALFFAKRRQLV